MTALDIVLVAVTLIAIWGICRAGHLSRRLREGDREAEQLRVQLAGCSVAAYGSGQRGEKVAIRGEYGWSVAYQDVLDLRRKYEMVVDRMVVPCGELDKHSQTLCYMQHGHGGPCRLKSGLAFATEHRKALAASKAQTPPESNPGGVETASPEMSQPSEGAV